MRTKGAALRHLRRARLSLRSLALFVLARISRSHSHSIVIAIIIAIAGDQASSVTWLARSMNHDRLERTVLSHRTTRTL